MMAPDSRHPPRVRISSETLEVLHDALAGYARLPGDDQALRAALRQLSIEARENGAPPEDVLIHLKQAWSTVTAGESHAELTEHSSRLQRVVTMCIKEYFS